MRFRKKPVVIEALQFRGDNFGEIEEFTGDKGRPVLGDSGNWFAIYSLEGVMRANPGDWIIKGVIGEIYPCQPEIFAKTYELAEPTYLPPERARQGGFMALETLKGVKEIGGFSVVVMDELREKHPDKFNESGAMDYKWFEKDVRPHNFIYVRHDVGSIAFTIQNGPIKEHGLNGCQVDTIIETAKIMIEGLSAKFPCRENSMIITKLDEALMWSAKRKADREKRGVEGQSKK